MWTLKIRKANAYEQLSFRKKYTMNSVITWQGRHVYLMVIIVPVLFIDLFDDDCLIIIYILPNSNLESVLRKSCCAKEVYNNISH